MSGVAALAGAGAALAAAAVAAQAQRWVVADHARRRLRSISGPASPSVPLPPWLRNALQRAGLDDDADQLIRRWAVAVLATTAVAAVVPSGRILLAVTVAGPPVALQLAGGRAARQRSAQLPDALDAVAAGLRGGLALPAAIAGAASVGPPLGPELQAVATEVEHGRPVAEALERWQGHSGDPHTALAGAALSVAARVGGPGARAIDGAAASLRDRRSSEAEASALATQGRASAAVLTLAPIGFALLLTSLDPTAGRFLLGTPAGWLCITVGLGLDAIGAWWMARLVRRAR